MATLTEMSLSFQVDGDNDCGNDKYFHNSANGNGFSACEIFYKDPDGSNVQYLDVSSDVLAKFDKDTNNWSYSADALDISFSGNKTGSWEYNRQNTSSPDIRFWTAKAGNGFKLFWMVDDTLTAQAACNPDAFTLDCLNLAKAVTGGSWSTPSGKGLSHLTFFGGTDDNDTPCTNCPVIAVPEPQTIILFGFAILALATRQKRLTLFKVRKD
tara:strand:- start:1563 stop:2198 length:636 start_codon:yes stop_codon:yes gene_type:complete